MDLGTAGTSQARGELSCGPSPCSPRVVTHETSFSEALVHAAPSAPRFELSLSYLALCLGPSEVGLGWVRGIGQ